jgi:tRNA dimethylallyltransferase
MKRRAILIAGPTASGKSALAIEKAKACGGFVVNADSMQVYDVLNVLTARPSAADLAHIDHYLYGYIHPGQNYSVARWGHDVEMLLMRDDLSGRTPVFVGGTGLYFKALTGELSAMPDVPDDIRRKWRARLADVGAEALHALLSVDDRQAGQRIKPQDGQRIVRALEIFEASGQPITYWQAQRSRPLIDVETSDHIYLMPERAVLDVRIVARLHKMVRDGALEEVAKLRALHLDPALPAMKAIGVPEFTGYLAGKMDLEAALRLVTFSTRQYVKRQTTWLRHQTGPQWSIFQFAGMSNV